MNLKTFLYVVLLLFWLFLPDISLGSNVATSLSIDVSGSMTGRKLEEAKKAASVYVDFIKSGDYISVNYFSNDAKVIVPMQSIMSDNDRYNIKEIIDRLQASGSTNIGSGIREGLKELRKLNTSIFKNIILMTDGQHNTGSLWPYVDESLLEGIPIHTIGFGNDADMKTLCEISKKTGGFCFYADERNLSYIYYRTGLVVYNISNLFSFSDLLKPDQVHNYPIFISDDIKDIVIFIHWINGSLNYDIIDGNGGIVSVKEEKKGANYRILRLKEIQDRNLTVRLKPISLPQNGTQVNVSIAGESPFYTSVIGLKPYYNLRENVEIRVVTGKVKDGKRVPIDNARVHVEVIRPSDKLIKKGGELNIVNYLFSKLLKKQNVSMDYEGNGIYIGHFRSTDINGPYIINITVEADVNGKPYKREFREIFNVGRVEDSPITLGDLFSAIKNLKKSDIQTIKENPLNKLKNLPLPIPVPTN